MPNKKEQLITTYHNHFHLEAIKMLKHSQTTVKKISGKDNKAEIIIKYKVGGVLRSVTAHVRKTMSGQGLCIPVGFELWGTLNNKRNETKRIPILRVVKFETGGLFT